MEIDSRYQVKGTLGSGSQGCIAVATDKKTGKEVALKIYKMTSNKGRESFNHEVSLQDLLKHKSSNRICNIIECLASQEYGFIVMKKYEGDLYDIMFNKKVQFSDKRLKKLFKQIVIGVKQLHDVGVAHLDIKPENILLDSKSKPFLCDFGSIYINESVKRSKLFKAKNVHKEVKGIEKRGTRKYAAPESYSQSPFDPFIADVYSLGVMLFVMVTKMFPVEEAFNQMKENLNPLCLDLISSLLNVNPADRLTIDEILSHPWLSRKSKNQRIFIR